MRRSTALMSLAAVAVMASNAFAQSKNFAGTWNMVMDPAQQQAGGGGGGGRRGGGGGGGGMGGGFSGMTFTVAQDDKAITITRTQGENTITTKYNLDGSDSKNTVQGRNGAQEIVSKAKWDGNALVISTTRPGPNGDITTTQKVWMEGDSLVIENATPNFQDPSAAPTVRKVTYKKG